MVTKTIQGTVKADGSIQPDLPTTLVQGEKVKIVIPVEKLKPKSENQEGWKLLGAFRQPGVELKDEDFKEAKRIIERGALKQERLIRGS